MVYWWLLCKHVLTFLSWHYLQVCINWSYMLTKLMLFDAMYLHKAMSRITQPCDCSMTQFLLAIAGYGSSVIHFSWKLGPCIVSSWLKEISSFHVCPYRGAPLKMIIGTWPNDERVSKSCYMTLIWIHFNMHLVQHHATMFDNVCIVLLTYSTLSQNLPHAVPLTIFTSNLKNHS